MKKEYIVPETKEYNIGILLMLNTSGIEGDGLQFSRRRKRRIFDEDEEDDFEY